MTIVQTAITPPKVPHAQIERPRLSLHLDAVDRSRVTTIFAPAGYGKTAAALHWAEMLAERDRPVLWLAARAGIRDEADFLDALYASACAAGLLSGSGPGAIASVNDFVAMIAAQEKRPVLVIDDAQMLPGEVFEFVAQLVMGARDAITTIIVSRTLKIIPIARLRSLGHLVEIGTAELRFSAEETHALARVIGGKTLADDGVRQLLDDTEGWPAGVAMACIVQGRLERGGEAVVVRPSGLRREFEDYFNEEVVSREPLETRNFLVDTMVLDELTPAACAAVTGQEDARLMLEAVEEAGLFLHSVDADRSSYRYHPLFREMVLRRLNDRDPARAAELQRRASAHFTAAGDSLKAVEHARRSGDLTFLADQLDRLADSLVYSGHLHLLDALAAPLPSTLFERRPRLALAIAWRRIRSLAYESAQLHISLAENEVNTRLAGDYDPLEIRSLERAIEHRRLMLAAALDNMDVIKDRAEALLRQFGDSEPYLSCTLLAQLMTSRRELYHFQDMLRLEAEVRRALDRPGSDFAAIALKASIAPTLAAQGKTDTAEALLRQALSYAGEKGGRGIAAIPALPLAEILYDLGQVDEARTLVEEHLPLAREWGFVDQLASGHLVQARLIFNAGDLGGALKALEEMQLLAIGCGLDRLRAYAVSEQVRMLVRSGETKEARTALLASGLLPDGEPVPTLNPTRRHESIAIAAIRIDMHEHRLGQARKIARRWSEFVRRNGAMRSGVVFGLLLAEIAVLAGDRSEARRAVREAVTLAAHAGWTQIFLDEGEAIRSLLTEAYGQGPELDSVPDLFGKRLVNAFAGSVGLGEVEDEEDYGLSSRLVNREIDILRMVGGGLRNREIGDRLGLTEGTVKWYMQQIYDKLGVRRRPQAVTRARQLGVLA